MNPESIYKIEQLLDELENTGRQQLSDRLPKFLNSVCDAVNLPHEVLFNSTNEPTQKKFIAVCLLRLLCRNLDAIWKNRDFRTKTCILFDNQISSIYRNLDITESDPNHEKLEKLLETEQSVLKSFGDLTDSIVSLHTVPVIREKFMRTLNFQQNKLFLEQFVTRSLINTGRINQIFETAQIYNESPIEDRFVSHQDMENVFAAFLRDAEKDGSIFTEQCIVAPIQKIYDYIQEDFKNNDASKPTTVAISPLDRKYPLHEIDKQVELKFRVKNQGPGYAFGVQIDECVLERGLTPCNPVNLGNLAPNQSSEITLKTTVEGKIKGNPFVMGQISWQHFDKKRGSNEFDFELIPQRTDLNWADLESQQPYSLEAINEAEDLVGRTKLREQLNARLSANRIESSIIHGQKRVGKTSIAEVIRAKFAQCTNYSVIFIPINGLDTRESKSFVVALGNRIVRLVSRTSKLIAAGIEPPSFEGSLAPLVEYFEDAKDILSEDHKFIIILDEFDEIPPDMVQVGNSVGQTFFNNIRAISSTGYVGFVLVGGENMQIIRESTDQLNKMTSFRVDYFDKGTYWDDFQELVRRPVKGIIEFNYEAINALYEITEGHPFYTKAICREIYTTACVERNAYISEDNVKEAVQGTIELLDLNAVSHFWIDGISKRHDPAQRDDIQTQRRKFLIAFARKRREESVNKQDLQDSELLRNIEVDKIIDQYITRGFLIEEDGYRWKPKFFKDWLTHRGFLMLTSEFSDEESIRCLREKEEEAYVSPREIVDLCGNWGLYKGSKITADDVRAWLEQFEYKTEQRLMFNLLKHVRFYSEEMIREKIGGLHRKVQQNVAAKGGITPGDRRQRRNDILLSSFGSPAKSGSSYARIYATENNIFVRNVVPFNRIPKALRENSEIKAIVFVDDIIASGDSAVGDLNQLNTIGASIHDKQVTVFIAAVCGLHTGIEKLEDAIGEVPFDVQIIVSDILAEADQCFNPQASVFSSSDEQNRAKRIVLEYGEQLEKKYPLGYNDNQLLVVFHENCPNNTLPILRKESTGNTKWTPLFKRS